MPILFAFIYKIRDDQVKQGELELRICNKLKWKQMKKKYLPHLKLLLNKNSVKRILRYMLHQIRTLQDTFYNDYTEKFRTKIKEGLTKAINNY